MPMGGIKRTPHAHQVKLMLTSGPLFGFQKACELRGPHQNGPDTTRYCAQADRATAPEKVKTSALFLDISLA
jgi:hypothetical protein